MAFRVNYVKFTAAILSATKVSPTPGSIVFGSTRPQKNVHLFIFQITLSKINRL